MDLLLYRSRDLRSKRGGPVRIYSGLRKHRLFTFAKLRQTPLNTALASSRPNTSLFDNRSPSISISISLLFPIVLLFQQSKQASISDPYCSPTTRNVRECELPRSRLDLASIFQSSLCLYCFVSMDSNLSLYVHFPCFPHSSYRTEPLCSI